MAQSPPFALKKAPGQGMCPVRGCRRLLGTKKILCDMHHQRSYRSAHPVRGAYRALKDHAKERGKVFTLTYEQFQDIVALTCYITEKGHTRLSLHIDRKDPCKGYEAGNIQVLTNSENAIKAARERFVPYLTALRAHGSQGVDETDCPF